MEKFFKKNNKIIYVLSFLITLGLLCIIFMIKGIAPFGNRSLACNDGTLQYIDFFAYLKNVLIGSNNLGYTFSKTLGGTSFALFTYYLASPFNVLVVFFDKSNMNTFFDLLVALKLATASATMAFFLRKRFAFCIGESVYKKGAILLLGICYGLSQYEIAQSSNIMWLDGAYMLPLILLGIYELVWNGRSWKLTIFVALSIIFNWYTGGINCIFTAFWLCLELLLFWQNKSRRKSLKQIFIKVFQYGYSMIIGVLLSACLFLPTVKIMGSNSKGHLEWGLLKDWSFFGDFSTIIKGYSIGGISDLGFVSLFCGSIIIIGVIALIVSRGIEIKKKVILVVTLVVSLLFFYWKPFYTFFSLFKSEGCYHYRYSYLGIVTLIFIATYYLVSVKKKKTSSIILSSCIFIALIVLLNVIKKTQNWQNVWITVGALTITSLLICLFVKQKSIKRKRAVSVLIALIVLFELTYNANLLYEKYSVNNVKDYKNYVYNNSKQIDQIKKDKSFYRINQTGFRQNPEDHSYGAYNESLVYNYCSMAGYSSCPDGNQLDFLDRMGYRNESGTFNVAGVSVLSTDSLLGVKYIISKNTTNGLKKTDITDYNNKAVFANPYYFPISFKYKKIDKSIKYNDNTFEYQNSIYRALSGEKVDIFKKLSITKEIKTDSKRVYCFDNVKGNYVLYGNIIWSKDLRAKLNVNGQYTIPYAQFSSQSVFYIPIKGKKSYLELEFNKNKKANLVPQIYALDLDKLKRITNTIRGKRAEKLIIENGKANISVTADDNNDRLFISIPSDPGWEIKVNGIKKDNVDVFEDCFYSIPLEKGINKIEMSYSVPSLPMGIALSFIGILLLIITVVIEKKKRKDIIKECKH